MFQKIYRMKNILIAIILLFAFNVSGQVINLEAKAGYGFYNLDDIKRLQTSLLEAVSLPGVKAVETFPNNFYYSFALSHVVNNTDQIGLEFSYFTTGGRNHLADYSGEYKVDMLLNGYQIGPKYEDYFLQYDDFKIGIQLAGGVIFSVLTIEEILRVNEEILSEDLAELKSTGWFVEPLLVASYNVFDKLNIKISGGYNFSEKGELKFDKKKTELAANWSGIRFLVGIDYSLNFKNK